MASNIKITRIKNNDMLGGNNLDVSNVDNSNFEEIRKIDPDDKKGTTIKDTNFLDEIAAFFGIGPSIKDGIDLLQANGIWGQNDNVESVCKCGSDNENIRVNMINGDHFLFIPNGDGYTLKFIVISDGTTIRFNIPKSEQQEIKSIAELKDDVPIMGYATININDYSTRVYWINDGETSYKRFREKVLEVNQALDNVPTNVMDQIKANFKGFFVGSHNSQTSHEDSTYNAYARKDEFIYISMNGHPSYETILHELGHTIDYSIGDGTRHSSVTDQQLNSFYDHYSEVIKEIIPSNSGYHYDGPTNVKEFFACTFNAYLTRPDELRMLIPDLYDYFDNIIRNI